VAFASVSRSQDCWNPHTNHQLILSQQCKRCVTFRFPIFQQRHPLRATFKIVMHIHHSQLPDSQLSSPTAQAMPQVIATFRLTPVAVPISLCPRPVPHSRIHIDNPTTSSAAHIPRLAQPMPQAMLPSVSQSQSLFIPSRTPHVHATPQHLRIHATTAAHLPIRAKI
jgi:hypothetical protein